MMGEAAVVVRDDLIFPLVKRRQKLTFKSYVRLNGLWHMSGVMFALPQTVYLVQDGHSFWDAALRFDDGVVLGFTLAFTCGEYQCLGEVQKNSQYIAGRVWSTTKLKYLGQWKAVKVDD